MHTSSMVAFRRGILRGILTLQREKQWATALGALFGVMLLVQLLGIMLIGLEAVQSLLQHRTDLRLELRQEATDRDVQNFYSALSALPIVTEAVLITKEKAYENMRTEDPELVSFLEEFKLENPFADTIGVTLKNLDDYREFSTFVQDGRWSSVVNPTFMTAATDQEKQVHALLRVTQAARSLTMLILGVTAAALLFVTTELTRRRALARSDEVLVERLVGATPLSILVPFATEATILYVISIAGSIVILSVLLVLIPLVIPGLGAGGALAPLRAEITPLLRTLLPKIILLEIVCAPVIATFGAWLGIRPQIESPRIAYA